MSTNVQQTMAVAAMMPPAPTMSAVSLVPVFLDMTEMDSPVQVSQFYFNTSAGVRDSLPHHVTSVYHRRLKTSLGAACLDCTRLGSYLD